MAVGRAPLPTQPCARALYSVVREVGIRLRDTGAVGSCVELNALRCRSFPTALLGTSAAVAISAATSSFAPFTAGLGIRAGAWRWPACSWPRQPQPYWCAHRGACGRGFQSDLS